MNFNLKKAAIYKAIKWQTSIAGKLLKPAVVLLFIASFTAAFLFSYGVLTNYFQDKSLSRFLGGSLISFFIGLFLTELYCFFETKLKNPSVDFSLADFLKNPDEFNIAELLSLEAGILLRKALKADKKAGGISEPKFISFFASAKIPEIGFIFFRAGLNFKELQSQLKVYDFSQRSFISLEKLILKASELALSQKKQKISVGDLFTAVCFQSQFLQKFLIAQDLKSEDIFHLCYWFFREKRKLEQSKKFWELSELLKRGVIARDWASGYTITLDRFSFDWVEKCRKNGFRQIVGHNSEIQQTERVLEKTQKNSPILIGEPGVGRKSIIEALSQKAFFGNSVGAVNYKRFLQFDIGALAAEITSEQESEAILDKCFTEAYKAGNVILVLDEFHNFVDEKSALGQINISSILSRYLSLSDFRVIALTSYEGLHKIIEKNPSLLNQMEKIEVSEITPQETLILIEDYYLPFFEYKLKRIVSYKALREIVKLSSRFLPQAAFPDKAVKLLDESITYLSVYAKDKVLEPRHIKKVVSEKTQIPLEDLETKEKDALLNMEKLMHERIVNQEEAVSELASALRRARAEIKTKGGPIGTFLFLGPTGVGKTETAKALSQIYFGDEKRMLRFDMSEFQTSQDISRLIGSFGEQGVLTTSVRENPFSLVLLDELEKAHPNILNLFLQVLDEGFLTDGVGRKVDFQNTIIIATSNAGAELIRQDIAKDKKLDIIKEELLDYLLRENLFKPEFINRFDGVVVFKTLTKEHLLSIAQRLLKKVENNLRDKGIELEITDALKQKIVELSYSPVFGAREMKRVIQDNVENLLAESLLSGKIKRGDRARLEVDSFGNIELIKI